MAGRCVMRKPRIQIVRSDAAQPFHVRIVAANNRIIFHSEQYTRRDSAMKAIVSLATAFGALDSNEWVQAIVDVDERDPNRCEDCGHAWHRHANAWGCAFYTEADGFCRCSEAWVTEGNSTNGPQPVVVDG